MRQRLLWILISVVALSCAASWGSRAQTSSRTRWEYKVISSYATVTNPPPNVQELSNAGAQGWELVGVHSGDFPKPGSNQSRIDYYFKRAK